MEPFSTGFAVLQNAPSFSPSTATTTTSRHHAYAVSSDSNPTSLLQLSDPLSLLANASRDAEEAEYTSRHVASATHSGPAASSLSSSSTNAIKSASSNFACNESSTAPGIGLKGSNTPMQDGPHASNVTRHHLLSLKSNDSLGSIRIGRDVISKGLDILNSFGSLGSSMGLSAECEDSYSPDKYFYSRNMCGARRDLDQDLNPITLGILDMNDAQTFFEFFKREILPMAPILDPETISPQRTLARSSLLMCAICLVAAQSMPNQKLMTTRLQLHTEKVCEAVFLRNFCSLEIVQGLNVLSCWPRSAHRVEDDTQGKRLTLAIGMVLELRVDECFKVAKTYDIHEQSDSGKIRQRR